MLLKNLHSRVVQSNVISNIALNLPCRMQENPKSQQDYQYRWVVIGIYHSHQVQFGLIPFLWTPFLPSSLEIFVFSHFSSLLTVLVTGKPSSFCLDLYIYSGNSGRTTLPNAFCSATELERSSDLHFQILLNLIIFTLLASPYLQWIQSLANYQHFS